VNALTYLCMQGPRSQWYSDGMCRHGTLIVRTLLCVAFTDSSVTVHWKNANMPRRWWSIRTIVAELSFWGQSK